MFSPTNRLIRVSVELQLRAFVISRDIDDY
jgi:hypothetical protein